MGAAYFESELVDYDVCANWGNWSYAAGVGCDPRENRRFNIQKQAGDYDPRGEYVRLWMPELAHRVSHAAVHSQNSLGRPARRVTPCFREPLRARGSPGRSGRGET